MAKAKAPEKKASKSASKNMTKSALLQAVTEALGEGANKRQVKQTLEVLTDIGHKELKKHGLFVLPGFAKFVVVKKAAKPAREGINPFTKQPMTFPAKPASKAVKARPVKAIKQAVV